MNELEKIRKNLSFLVDDTLKPSLIVHLNGDILYENKSFKVLNTSNTEHNITAMIDNDSSKALQTFSEKAITATQMIMDVVPVSVQLDEQYECMMRLFTTPENPVIVALFDMDSCQNNLPVKTYINAFNKSSNLVAMIGEDGRLRDINKNYSRFLNTERNQLVGKHIETIMKMIDPEKKYDFSAYLEMVRAQGSVESFNTYQQSTEEIRHFHITTYYDEETTMFFVELEDWTEKENLQVQLAHSGSLSAVGQIAASIAHEIRNPITTLKGFTQLLKASATEDSIRYISVIEDEIDRMESILGEMLLLSKPAVKKKTVFSLEGLIGDMVGVLYPKAVMDGIEVEKIFNVGTDSLIHGDADRFKQILLNLFKNALESMTKGGKLSITLSEDEEKLLLSIKDTGKGMTLHQVNQVFMPFFSSKPGGTGLGLPFVLKTVEEHGGTIAVESQIDKGTTFVLTFPKVNEGTIIITKNKQSILS